MTINKCRMKIMINFFMRHIIRFQIGMYSIRIKTPINKNPSQRSHTCVLFCCALQMLNKSEHHEDFE